jgi:hypothetical protein
MDEKDKIVQITGSGDILYALSSEGKLYIGTLSEKKGFEWRRLPEMNLEKIKTVSLAITEDESSGPVFVAPEGGIKTAALIKDEEPAEPKVEAPKAEAPKPTGPVIPSIPSIPNIKK